MFIDIWMTCFFFLVLILFEDNASKFNILFSKQIALQSDPHPKLSISFFTALWMNKCKTTKLNDKLNKQVN